MLIAARQKARTDFDAGRSLIPESEDASEKIRYAYEVAKVLREEVLQGEEVEKDRYRMFFFPQSRFKPDFATRARMGGGWRCRDGEANSGTGLRIHEHIPLGDNDDNRPETRKKREADEAAEMERRRSNPLSNVKVSSL